MQGLYNGHDHDIASTQHHHQHHLHHNDRYQLPRHRRSQCQQCQILSPWLHQATFGISGGDVPKLVSGISLTNIQIPMSVPTGNLAMFIKQCCAVFFMATVLMAPCCEARAAEPRIFDRLPRNNRVLREVHNSTFNSTIPTSTHSVSTMASTKSSSLSPPSTLTPRSYQQLSSAAVEQNFTDSSSPHEQATKSELIALLISTLEKLNAIQATDSTCLRLQKIVQKNIDSSSSSSTPSSLNHNMFGVYLYFEEVHVPSVNTSASSNMSSTNSYNNRSVSVLNNTCVSDPIIEIPRPVGHPLYRGEVEDDNGTVVVADVGSSTAEVDGIDVLHTGSKMVSGSSNLFFC